MRQVQNATDEIFISFHNFNSLSNEQIVSTSYNGNDLKITAGSSQLFHALPFCNVG